MNLATFDWLLTPAGQALLAEAQRGLLSEPTRLSELEHLRRLAAPDYAAAAYETAWLRRRAAGRFRRAAELYFTREALEQASGDLVATYRARRFAGIGHTAELCCGIGGDTLALAQHTRVTAIDNDPLRLAMAAANAAVCGLSERITFVQRDLEHEAPPQSEAIFFDPARRRAGRRVFRTADYTPPLELAATWRRQTPTMAIKVAPGISDDDLAALEVPEVEFIALDGELKEATLWYGPQASAGRIATVIETSGGSPQIHRLHATQAPAAPLAEPAGYLCEPDPSVIRAHLIAELAAQLNAAQLDPQIAYLITAQATPSPFARFWRILEWHPFNLKRLSARLRTLDAGPVTVKKRGSPIDTDELARKLSGNGSHALVVVLTIMQGTRIAIICAPPTSGGLEHPDA